MKKIINFAFCFFVFLCLSSENLKISIRYLKLPVVKVELQNVENTINITAKATGLGKIAAKLNNYYKIQYSTHFLPNYYEKKIQQSDFQEDKITYYHHDIKEATEHNFLTNDKRTYPIQPETRDFFSSLFFLRTELKNRNKGMMWLDANHIAWIANWEIVGKEEIKTFSGKQNAIKVKLTFQKTEKREKERSDMLTNNLVKEDSDLFFWFSDDEKKLPLKAIFAMKPFSVVWILDEYQDF